MKAKLWLAVLLLAGITVCLLLILQRREINRQKQLIETLQLQIENSAGVEQRAKSEFENTRKENQALRQRLTTADIELNRERIGFKNALEATNAYRIQTPTSTAAENGSRPANPLKAIAEMMKDPETKKAMAQQQRAALDMIYGNLFKELQLTPEKTEKLKDLLIEQQMSAMSDGMTMFDETNSTNRAESGKKMAEQQKQKEEQIKALLGAEKFPQYKEYMSTLGERMILDQFAKQSNLQPEQRDQLLAIMKEEKEFAQSNQPAGLTSNPNDWQKLMASDEFMEKQIAQQQQINDNILERAREVLTPEQFTKFESQLKSQLAMQQLGLKMARKMISPEPAPAAPAQK